MKTMLMEVQNTYKQIEKWVKTPSITFKTDDMIIVLKSLNKYDND